MMSSVGTVKIKKNRQPKGEVFVPEIEETSTQRTEARLARNSQRSLSDDIAGHFIFYRNHYWPGCKQAFPHDHRMQFVDKFYPFAEGGPLFVDEEHPREHRDLKAKTEIMNKLGHRYLVIKQNMTLLEAREALA